MRLCDCAIINQLASFQQCDMFRKLWMYIGSDLGFSKLHYVSIHTPMFKKPYFSLQVHAHIMLLPVLFHDYSARTLNPRNTLRFLPRLRFQRSNMLSLPALDSRPCADLIRKLALIRPERVRSLPKDLGGLGVGDVFAS